MAKYAKGENTQAARVLQCLINHEGTCITPKQVAEETGLARSITSNQLSRFFRECDCVYRPRQGHYVYDPKEKHINFDTRKQEFLHYIFHNKNADGCVDTAKMQEHMGMTTQAFYSELSRMRADKVIDYEMVHYLKLGATLHG